MALSLTAEQRNIEQIFGSPEVFIIPAYQRPYSWEYDQCIQLYKDLTDAFNDNEKDYFVGNIIVAKSLSERNNRYVVDGQQRLITLWLMLRILYLLYPDFIVLEKLTSIEGREKGQQYLMKLQSYVFENKDNDSLEEIFNIKEESQLENIYNNYCNRLGNFVESRCENRILANALWFYYWLKDFRLKDICRFKSFINYLLDHLYLLPIELTEDSVLNANNKALKIFETINNRGMNLEDADIFKAKLYDKAVANNEREVFIKSWTDFRQSAHDLGLAVDDIFRYYSHIIRGQRQITASEKNLREFFIEEDFSPLITASPMMVLSDMNKIIDCINFVQYSKYDGSEVSKWLQVISAYTNQYPMYAIVIYLYFNGHKNNKSLIDFLKSIIRFIYPSGTTTTIKFEIYNIIRQVAQGEQISEYYNNHKLKESEFAFPTKLRKGFALLNYYLKGGEALVEFNYDKIIKAGDIFDVKEYNSDDILQSLGNDLILDIPRRYIEWGEEKKNYYKKSAISDVAMISNTLDIASYIKNREQEIKQRLYSFFYTYDE